MRLWSVLLVTSVTLHAGSNAVMASTELALPQLAFADGAQRIDALQIGNRFLRTADTTAIKDEGENEERGFDLRKWLAVKFHPKYVHKDGTFTNAYVLKLVEDTEYREKTFQSWAAEIDAEKLKNSLGNLDGPGRELLLKEYNSFLNRPGTATTSK